ncbi:MAG: hypothetical protein ACI90M_003541, partial [Candidatus Azotimanducaceae bacterium]
EPGDGAEQPSSTCCAVYFVSPTASPVLGDIVASSVLLMKGLHGSEITNQMRLAVIVGHCATRRPQLGYPLQGGCRRFEPVIAHHLKVLLNAALAAIQSEYARLQKAESSQRNLQHLIERPNFAVIGRVDDSNGLCGADGSTVAIAARPGPCSNDHRILCRQS